MFVCPRYTYQGRAQYRLASVFPQNSDPLEGLHSRHADTSDTADVIMLAEFQR